MEDNKRVELVVNNKTNVDDAEVVKKILNVVVKRRKIIPTKCTEYIKEAATYEMMALENSKVILKERKDKKKFKKVVQELQKFNSFHYSLDDLHETERKLLSYHKKMKEINIYLDKKKCLHKDDKAI